MTHWTYRGYSESAFLAILDSKFSHYLCVCAQHCESFSPMAKLQINQFYKFSLKIFSIFTEWYLKTDRMFRKLTESCVRKVSQ